MFGKGGLSLLTLVVGSAVCSEINDVVVNDNGSTGEPGSPLDLTLPPRNKTQANDTKAGQHRHQHHVHPAEHEEYNSMDDPYWEPPDFDNDEDEAEYYGPLDRFWRHSAKTKSLVLGDEDYYSAVQACMNDKLTSEEWAQIRQPQKLKREMGERFMDPLGKGPVFLVEIKHAMSPIHAKAVRTLNVCVRTHISQLYEHRPMYQVYKVEETADEQVKDEMGGNNPTHLNSIIGIFLPDVVKEQYKTLEMAYQYAGWQGMVVRDEIMGKYRTGPDAAFTSVAGAGMRACEYLNYEGFSRLMEHQDGMPTSVVLNVMLSDANKDYEGGAFYIADKFLGDYYNIRPDQYSALAFLGGTFSHGVDPITPGGQREALSTEFWYYPDLPFGVNLCAAEFANVEEYIRRCNEVQWNDDIDAFDYDIPCNLEFPTDSIYGVCKSHGSKGTIKETNIYSEQKQQQ